MYWKKKKSKNGREEHSSPYWRDEQKQHRSSAKSWAPWMEEGGKNWLIDWSTIKKGRTRDGVNYGIGALALTKTPDMNYATWWLVLAV